MGSWIRENEEMALQDALKTALKVEKK